MHSCYEGIISLIYFILLIYTKRNVFISIWLVNAANCVH